MTVFLAGLFMLSPNDQSVAIVFALGYFKCPCLAFVVAFFFIFVVVFLRCLTLILSHLLNKYTLFFVVVVSFFIPGPCLSPNSGFLFVCLRAQEAPCSKINKKLSA